MSCHPIATILHAGQIKSGTWLTASCVTKENGGPEGPPFLVRLEIGLVRQAGGSVVDAGVNRGRHGGNDVVKVPLDRLGLAH